MSLKDLLATVGQLKNIQGVEAALRKRKRNGFIVSGGTILVGLIEVIRQLGDSSKTLASYFSKVFQSTLNTGEFLWLKFKSIFVSQVEPLPEFAVAYDVLGFYLVVTGIVIYLVVRHTSFLFQASKEPFQYTFWIDGFKNVNETKTGADEPTEIGNIRRFLHHELMDLLNQRIGRFSLLDDSHLKSNADGVSQTPSSHIHIDGNYTVRDLNKDGKKFQVVEIMPRVRFGPPGSPSTLTPKVVIDLLQTETMDGSAVQPSSANPNVEQEKPDAVTFGDISPGSEQAISRQIREQVYSRIASEIYKQIRIDIKKKLHLFPTRYLRAIALYHEAKDFSTSNTIDSYDYAIELYKESLRLYDISLRTIFSKWLARLRWFRVGLDYEMMLARTNIEYAKSLIYRRIVSSFTGRTLNPLYDIPVKIGHVAKQLTYLHNKFHLRRKISYIEQTDLVHQDKEQSAKENRYRLSLTALLYSEDSWIQQHIWRGLGFAKFTECRELLFDAYVVLALAYATLNGQKKARNCLEMAVATDPEQAHTSVLYLLTKSETIADLRQKAPLLQQATEMAPRFEIAQYLLAQNTLRLMSLYGELDAGLSLTAIKEFEKVLSINPGNVATYANLGNLHWLINESDKAEQRFEQGIGTKTAVQETFIGELVYGLARIAARNGEFHRSRNLYHDALSVDPGIGAYSFQTFSSQQVSSVTRVLSYYELISPASLARYKMYLTRFETLISEIHSLLNSDDIIEPEKLMKMMQEDQLDLFSFIGASQQNIAQNLPMAAEDNPTALLNMLRSAIRCSDLADYIMEKDNRILQPINEIKKLIVYIPNDLISTIRLNRHLLDMLYPGCLRPCKDHRKKNISAATINATYSYVLNDYANACLNYYHRHGDVDRLREAIRSYERAVRLKPDFAIAYYNLANATDWLGYQENELSDQTHAKKVDFMRQADKNMTTQSSKFIIESVCDSIRDLPKTIRNIEYDIQNLETRSSSLKDDLEKTKEKITELKNRQSQKPKKDRTGRESGTSGSAKNQSDVEQPADSNDLTEEVKMRRPGAQQERGITDEARTEDYDRMQSSVKEMQDKFNEEKLEDELDNSKKELKLAHDQLKKARGQLKQNRMEFTRQFEKGLERAVKLSNLSAVFEGLGYSPQGRTIGDFQKLKIRSSRLDAREIEALTGWATLLSIDATDKKAAWNCIELCDFIEKFEEDTFSLDQLRYNVFVSLEQTRVSDELDKISRDDASQLIDRESLPEVFRNDTTYQLILYGFLLPVDILNARALLDNLFSVLHDKLPEEKKQQLETIKLDWRQGLLTADALTRRLVRFLNELIVMPFVTEELINVSHKPERQNELIEFALRGKLKGKDLFRFNRRLIDHLFPKFVVSCWSDFYARRIADTIVESWLAYDPQYYVALKAWSPVFLPVPAIEQYLKAAIQLDPPNVDVLHEQLALLFERSPGYEESAVESLEQADKDYSDKVIYKIALSRTLKQGKKYDEARRYLDMALANKQDIEEEYISELEAIYCAEVKQLKSEKLWHEAIAKCRQGIEELKSSIELSDLLEMVKAEFRRSGIQIHYGAKWPDQMLVVTPIAMEVAANLIPLVSTQSEGLDPFFENSLKDMRERILAQYGVSVPGVRIRGNETDLSDGVYILMLNEVPIVSNTIYSELGLVFGSDHKLEELGINTSNSHTLANGKTAYWLNADDTARAQIAGINILPPILFAIEHLETVIAANLVEFLGHQEVYYLIADKSHPDSDKREENLQKYKQDLGLFSGLTAVLRGLLASKVPIREFAAIFNYYEANQGRMVEPAQLITEIRTLPEIQKDLPGNQGVSRYLRIGQSIEKQLALATDVMYGGTILAMEPEICQECLTAVRNSISERHGTALIVNDRRLRMLADQLFRIEFPEVPVIATGEILNYSRIFAHPIEVIEIS